MAATNEIIQIEQIDKGLTALNSTINQTTQNYLKLVKTIETGNTVIKENTVSQDNLTKAQKSTSKAIEEKDVLNKRLAASEEKLKQAQSTVTEAIARNTLATNKANEAARDKAKLDAAAEGSLVRMRLKLKELTTEYDKTGTRTKAAAQEIDKLSREIGKAEAATNRHQRGVGGYADQLGKFKNVISTLPGPLGSAMGAAEGLVTKLGAFGPVGLWVGGAILSIGAPLAAFFLKSEKGVEMLERKFAGFKASMSVLVGELIKGGDKMAESFDKPAKSPFWGAILSTISPSLGALGLRMDMASLTAEKYTQNIQDMEEAERALIVPRAQANLKIKEARLLYNDESKSLKVRIDGIKEAIKLENETADIEVLAQSNRVSNLITINNLLEQNGQLRDSDKDKLEEAIAREIELKTESAGRQVRASAAIKAAINELDRTAEENVKKITEKKIELLEIESIRNKEIINKRHLDGITSEEQYKLELIGIEQISLEEKLKLYKVGSKEYEDIKNQMLSIDIKTADESIKIEEEAQKEKLKKEQDFEKNRLDNLLGQDKEILSSAKERNKEETDDYRKSVKAQEDLAKELAQYQTDTTKQAVAAIFELNAMRFDKEMNDLQVEKDAKLNNDKLTTEQRAQIEAEYQQKVNKIKTKQAQNDKLAALFQIAIETAIASIKAVRASPETFGLPFLPWVIAQGFISAALVATESIPKYAKGTKSAGEFGIFGEAGRELLFTRSGDTMLADKPTYFKGSKFKGARIFSNPETEKIIGASDRNIKGYQITDERLLNKMDEVKKAILQKPVAIFDKENRVIGHKTSQSQTIYLNRLLRNN